MYQFFLICHYLGMACGIGASASVAVLRFRAKGLPRDDLRAFMARVSALSMLGAGGVLLLILSGLAMTWLAEGSMVTTAGVFFWIKMALVVLLVAIIGFIHMNQARLRRGEHAERCEANLALLGPASLVTAVLIVIVATIGFG